MTLRNSILAAAMLVVVSGCSIQTYSENPEYIVSDQDKMDIARCAGSSNPNLSAMTKVQYRLYAECLVELDHGRNKSPIKRPRKEG